MKRFLAILLLTCQLAAAAAGDVLSATILATGREADITFEGLGTGGTYINGMSGVKNLLTGVERCRFVVTSHSSTALGAPTTIQRTVYGQHPRRKQYPNHAQNEESFGSGNTTVRVVLSDYIYVEDDTGAGNSGTAVTLTMLSGFYTKTGTPNNAVTGLTVTNDSAAVFQPGMAYWTMPSRNLVHDTFTISLVAFHRHWGLYRPVRVVKFEVTDENAHTVTVFSEDLSLTWNAGEQKPIQEYIASIPVTNFTEGDTLTCNATIYYWVGDNTLTSVGGPAEPTAGFGPRTFLLDKDNDYGITHVLVDPVSGVDPGAADATKAYDDAVYNEGTAYVFLTAGRAYASAVAYNLVNRGRNDGGAVKVHMKAGNYACMGSVNTYGDQPAVRPEFLPADGVSVSQVVINGETGSQDIGDLIKLTATVTSTVAGTFGGINDMWFHNSVINTTNTQLFITADSILTMTGGSIPQLGQGLKGTVGVNFSPALIRGVDLSGFNTTVRPYALVGCRGTSCGNLRIVDEVAGQSSPFLAPIFAYNEFLGITNAAGADVMLFGSLSNDVPGFFDVGNCIESITGTGAGGMITLYTEEADYAGGVRFCRTNVGAREFDRYNDGQPPANQSDTWLREYGVDAFGYSDRTATKMDRLPPEDGGRDGCASILFGTSLHCFYHAQNMWSLPGSFFKEFAGIGSWQPTDQGGTEALFVRRNASYIRAPSDPLNGEGNGVYVPQASSPLVGMPEQSGIPCPLRWDLNGVDRDGNNAAGAYVLPQNTRRPFTRSRRAKML